MRKIIIIASAIIALAACAKNDVAAPTTAKLSDGEDVITFGNYNGRSITKAGKVGDMVLDSLKKADAGFGVFAYYTGAKDFNGTVGTDANWNAAIAPNFMYNEKVYWDGASSWKYDNLKYWPNDNANADAGNSTGSVAASKLSFFAYAPYVNDTTALGTSGIVAISDNAVVQPKITYQIDPDGNTVDLLWGTAGSNGADVNDNAQPGAKVAFTNKDAAPDTTGYAMNVNLVKMKTDGKVQFAFKHALAQIGGSSTKTTTVLTPTRNTDGTAKPSANDTTATLKQGGLQVKLNVDNINGGELDRNTVITVKNIIVTNDINGDGVIDSNDDQTVTVPDPANPGSTTTETRKAGFVSRGDFNVVTGEWIASTDPAYSSGSIDMSVSSPAQNAEDAAAAAAASTTYTEPTVVMSKKIAEPVGVTAFSQLPMGVQVVPQSVYENGANPLVLMPGTVPVLRFTITYIVRSVDTKLQKQYTEVEQTISKIVSFNNAIEMNKMYNIIIALGLTSVKFDAIVSNWDTGTPEPVAYDPVTGDPIYGYDTTTNPATPITDPTDPRLDDNLTVHLPINVQ